MPVSLSEILTEIAALDIEIKATDAKLKKAVIIINSMKEIQRGLVERRKRLEAAKSQLVRYNEG